MKRVSLVIASLALVVGLAQQAGASMGNYVWTLDPPPFGPNATAAADGSVLTLIGGGTVREDGSASGGGIFEIADKAGNPVTAGAWTVSGPASVEDQGPLPEEVWENFVERGIVTAHISLEGVGDGTIQIYCAAGKNHFEGFRVKIGRVAYRKIVSASNTLMRSPA